MDTLKKITELALISDMAPVIACLHAIKISEGNFDLSINALNNDYILAASIVVNLDELHKAVILAKVNLGKANLTTEFTRQVLSEL
jgi:hypothetical protein